jgi:CBS domain-containing protein
MKAKDVMTLNVVSTQPQASVMQAIRIMLQKRISGLPVVDDAGRLVGMLTEGDLLRRAETGTQKHRPRWLEFLLGPGRLATEYVHTHGRKVEELMTHDPVTVAEDTSLDEVVKTMEKRGIKRVPVMRGEQLVGLISRANLLHALASVSRHMGASSVGDADIRSKLLAELEKESWAPIGALDVIVRDGIVELWGTITDERQREALVVAAENIQGVKSVRDHLVWIDTSSAMAFYPPMFYPPEEPAKEVQAS